MATSSSIGGADGPAAAGGVLERQQRLGSVTRRGAAARVVAAPTQHLDDRGRHPLDALFDRRVPVRPDVHVHDRGAVVARDGDVRGEDAERGLAEPRLGPGEVDEVGRVDRHGPDVELGEAGVELRESAGRPRAALPCGRVVDEDLDRPGADLAGPLRGASQALAEGEVDPDARRVTRRGGRAHRRVSARRSGGSVRLSCSRRRRPARSARNRPRGAGTGSRPARSPR